MCLQGLQGLAAGRRGRCPRVHKAVQQQLGLPRDVALLAARGEQQSRRTLHEPCGNRSKSWINSLGMLPD